MALKFGPQWLRDLGGDANTPQSPTTPTGNVKFKLADYRYGKEEMLCLYNENSPPPDQVRKHQTIFSKEIQKPITLMQVSEDEQRLLSQGFNSTIVLRAAGRATGPPPRITRGGGTMDRGRGRGRGRGEGFIPRTAENGDTGYRGSTQDGWEQVGPGRRFERNLSREGLGYEETGGPAKQNEYPRSNRDNWRTKREEEMAEEESGSGGTVPGGSGNWRSNAAKWGPPGATRGSWRDLPSRDGGYDNERRPPQGRRGFDHDSRDRGPRRISESNHDDDVPEWAQDDIEENQGTFDSKGVFVPTKENKNRNPRYDQSRDKRRDAGQPGPDPDSPRKSASTGRAAYVPPQARHTTQNGNSEREPPHDHSTSQEPRRRDHSDGLVEGHRGRPDSIDIPHSPRDNNYTSSQGAGDTGQAGVDQVLKDSDTGFAYPMKGVRGDTKAPPGQLSEAPPEGRAGQGEGPAPQQQPPPVPQAAPMGVGKDLRTFISEMTEAHVLRTQNQQLQEQIRVEPAVVDVSEQALPLGHFNAFKWFYRDPQGEVQGPFTADEMGQWFTAGYFTMGLHVKRGCDEKYTQLKTLITHCRRVPFFDGPPIPPIMGDLDASSEASTPPPPAPVPPLVSPMGGNNIPTMPNMAQMQDPLVMQQMLLQQEYLKHQLMVQQLQMQVMQQIQDSDRYKDLNMEQKHHLAMQMMSQINPAAMQMNPPPTQPQQQPQQLPFMPQHQLPTQQEQERSSPSRNHFYPSGANNRSQQEEHDDGYSERDSSPWASGDIGHSGGDSSWSQQPASQSLWDVPKGQEGAPNRDHQPQLAKLKKDREAARLKEERQRQEELEAKQSELRRQQDELERQKEQMMREKEELERQKQLELQKLEEAQRKEQERLRKIEDERRRKIEAELEKQKREIERQRQEEDTRRQIEERKRLDEERRKQAEEDEKKRRELELKKREELKKKEMSKKQQIEEQKRYMEELNKKEEQRSLAEQRVREAQQAKKEAEEQRVEDERMKREDASSDRMMEMTRAERIREEQERERLEAERKQQAELFRQQESLRRLHQAQREQMANIQLPAASKWAAQQSPQARPGQTRSLTDIQAEEARTERDNQREKQSQVKQMQELTQQTVQQNQQKSWATRSSAPRGPSLLDIQQQEAENSRKQNSNADNNPNSYQAKLKTALTSSSSGWGSNPSPLASNTWATSPSSAASPWDNASSIWGDTPPAPRRPQPQPVQQQQAPKKTVIKESGEFPALRNPAQQPSTKASKNKPKPKKQKEEETVKQLFSQNQKHDSFSDWVSKRVTQFSAQVDVPTFVAFIVEVDNPHDIRDYIKTYLGETRETNEFASQFIEKRSSFRNQARLKKQEEEDSIWGPAAAVNPYQRGGQGAADGFEVIQAKDKKTTKKKKKMQIE